MANANKVWIWSEQLHSNSFNSGTWHEYWQTDGSIYTRIDDGFQIRVFGWNSRWVISETEPDGPPEGPVGQKIEFDWKIEPTYEITVTQGYAPRDGGDLVESICEENPMSIRVTCVRASGVQEFRCGYCEEYSNDSEHGLCKGCGYSSWVSWEEDKHEVGYTYTL